MTETTDSRKVEVLKVWYSVFCTIMDPDPKDGSEYSPNELIAKLRALREKLREAYPGLEAELARSKQ